MLQKCSSFFSQKIRRIELSYGSEFFPPEPHSANSANFLLNVYENLGINL